MPEGELHPTLWLAYQRCFRVAQRTGLMDHIARLTSDQLRDLGTILPELIRLAESKRGPKQTSRFAIRTGPYAGRHILDMHKAYFGSTEGWRLIWDSLDAKELEELLTIIRSYQDLHSGLLQPDV